MDEKLKKNKNVNDPFAEREAAKYENPIPSRELILEVLDKSVGPMTLSAMCEHLQQTGDEQREAMRRRLIAMERDGQLMSNRKGDYGRVDKMDLVRGRIQGHRDGYGFVIPADGSDDIYLSNRQMRKVFDGDEVLARPGPANFKGNKEGSIVEVLVRNTTQLVGRLVSERGSHYVRPDNPRLGHDVLVPPDQLANAKSGQFVVVEIVQQPDRRNNPVGHILEVLGDHLAPGMEIDVAIRSHSIPHVWPSNVKEQAATFSKVVEESDTKNRIDLRDLPFVTIDGEDARDFDDAVYCEPKKSGGWRLFVAIADVSHYVAPNSPLDKEAIERGNSVYFPDFVVPMLPEALSNGLCSLNPHVDRLCMVCEMTISRSGRISGYQFYESVMHSKARLTYTQVGHMLDVGSKAANSEVTLQLRDQFAHVVKHVDELHNLYDVLLEARRIRGAIEFETTETRILFDENRKIDQIVPVVRNDAHKLIEECMLAANVCAARFLEKHEIPALYRVHASPKPEKVAMLKEFLGELGIGFTGGEKLTPSDFQTMLADIQGRPDTHLIQTVMLRSMNQAVYQPVNEGHFGLAYQAYAHFTSPIRRYPDLLVHRALRYVIRSKRESTHVKRHPDAVLLAARDIFPYSSADMAGLGEQCSITERRADEATRDVVSWLKCEFLKDRVGETFEGIVSAVVGFGLFVELKDVFVEGLIHITGLPSDYYHFQAAQHRLVGERTRQVFRLGDEVSVKVVRVSLDERKIDFELTSVKSRRRARAGELPPKKERARKGGAKAGSDKSTGAKSTGVKPKARGRSNTGKAGVNSADIKSAGIKSKARSKVSAKANVPAGTDTVASGIAATTARKPRKRSASKAKVAGETIVSPITSKKPKRKKVSPAKTAPVKPAAEAKKKRKPKKKKVNGTKIEG